MKQVSREEALTHENFVVMWEFNGKPRCTSCYVTPNGTPVAERSEPGIRTHQMPEPTDCKNITYWVVEETFEQDEPVMVRDIEKVWFRRHYAFLDGDKHQCYRDGQTSFTSSGKVTVWDQVRKPTKEELGCV